MKKIAIVTCILMLAGVRAEGQFFQSVDGWLKKQQQKQPYDTTYIYRPQERWRLRTTAQLEGESAMMVAVVPDGDSYGLKLDRRLKYKHTVGVGYRNLIVDAGFSPIGGKYTFGGAMNIMGNRVGVTLEGGLSTGFNGVALTGGETTSNLPDDGVIMMNVGLSAYYAFNGKHFSMPAAMNQAFRQLRSAGSFLATFTTRTYGMMRNPDLTVAIQPEFACTGLIGLGGLAVLIVTQEDVVAFHLHLAGNLCRIRRIDADGAPGDGIATGALLGAVPVCVGDDGAALGHTVTYGKREFHLAEELLHLGVESGAAEYDFLEVAAERLNEALTDLAVHNPVNDGDAEPGLVVVGDRLYL